MTTHNYRVARLEQALTALANSLEEDAVRLRLMADALTSDAANAADSDLIGNPYLVGNVTEVVMSALNNSSQIGRAQTAIHAATRVVAGD